MARGRLESEVSFMNIKDESQPSLEGMRFKETVFPEGSFIQAFASFDLVGGAAL